MIDLVAALKKSLAGISQEEPEKPMPTTSRKDPDRRQTGLKLPIAGGKSKAAEESPVKAPMRCAEPPAQPVRGRKKVSIGPAAGAAAPLCGYGFHVLVRVHGGVRSICRANLAHGVPNVDLHGRLAQLELIRDKLVRLTLLEQLENFYFPRG